MKIQHFIIGMALLYAGHVFAQANGVISNGTNSNANQTSTIENSVNFPSGGSSDVNYHGSYTVKSAPTLYSPSLTASITETCWGSISAGVSAIGFGVTGGATIKDYDCNRRLTAGVAWRMGRQDVAFNLMCQDDSFRAAAAITDKPCPSTTIVARQGTQIAPLEKSQKDADAHSNLVSTTVASITPTKRDSSDITTDPKTGQMTYQSAQVPGAH